MFLVATATESFSFQAFSFFNFIPKTNMADDGQYLQILNISAETSTLLKGTCMEMCPERERSMRERQRRLHPFEVLQESLGQRKHMKAKPKADIKCTVKEFSRPAAGRELQPDELRPASVLLKTMDFLLGVILAKSSPWPVKCNFVSDRIRAVRQDLTAQGIMGHEAIDILEKASRYYIVTAVKLRREPLDNFDPVLHNTHIQECLKKLLFLYELHGRTHSPEPTTYPNRPSFEACYLLINLGNTQAYNWACRLPERVRKSKIIELAFGITKAYLHGNYVTIFRTLTQLPFLESCAFYRHIEPIRCKALEVMNMAYSSKNLSYPLSSLTMVFCFDTDGDAVEFCSAHGVGITDGKVQFSKGQFVHAEKNTSKPSSCNKVTMSKLKGDFTEVFCKQCDWDAKVDLPKQLYESRKSGFESQNVVTRTAATKTTTTMVGMQGIGMVSGGKGYGRGRAWRK